MDKRSLTERDICTKFILPAVRRAGWDEMVQVREEFYFTRAESSSAASWSHVARRRSAITFSTTSRTSRSRSSRRRTTITVGDGMQQALDYAKTLDIPFVFSSNGDGFLFHDRTGETRRDRERTSLLDAASRRRPICGRAIAHGKGIDAESEPIVLQDYFDDGSGKAPRYYQAQRHQRTRSKRSRRAQNRILLVMATGTGKTYTAFQIIWRLWKAGRKKRILFLADRNVLDRSDDGQRLSAVRRRDGQASPTRRP